MTKSMDALEQIRATMREFKDTVPYVPEVYVMTSEAESRLREWCEAANRSQPASQRPDGFFADRIYGIPFESYPTIHECHERANELRDAGKQVALVCE